MGAPDLLQHLRGAGFSVTAAGGGICIAPASALTAEDRQAIRACRAELLALIAECPVKPNPGEAIVPIASDPDSWCWPYSEAMSGAELDACKARIERFTWRGINEAQAEHLADMMKGCDRQACGLRLCLDCNRLVGNVGQPWRCLSSQAAGVPSLLAADFVITPQRCPAFKAAL